MHARALIDPADLRHSDDSSGLQLRVTTCCPTTTGPRDPAGASALRLVDPTDLQHGDRTSRDLCPTGRSASQPVDDTAKAPAPLSVPRRSRINI